MKEIEIFNNPEFGALRIIVDNNGNPWFVGKEVAAKLGYKDLGTAILNHVEEDDRKALNYKAFGDIYPSLWSNKNDFSNKIIINENGLYDLIFGSDLPNAKNFKHWLTHEVLPSIRKHGIYATENVIDNILNNPDFGIELLTKLKEERAARIKAEQTNAILMHVNKTYTVTEIAKELNLKSAIELNKILSDIKIQYKTNNTWVMYSDYSNCGYEEIKQEVLDNGTVIYHRRITQLGREFILQKVKNYLANNKGDK